MATKVEQQQWQAGEPTTPRLHTWTERIAAVEALDRPAERVSGLFGTRRLRGSAKGAVGGTWIGHALHPVLTDVPIGTWTSATILDLVGGERTDEASRRLIGVGLVAAVPTALTGLFDWADTTSADTSVRRVGLVHGVANAVAMALFGGSLLARRRGRRALGVALGAGGSAVLAVGAHLGGHLVYAQGVGVDQTVFDDVVTDWTAVADDAELGEGDTRVGDVHGMPVLLTRQGGRVYALADRCSHRGGPLHEGSIENGCVTCPWHGSTFRLDDGSVESGPAAYPQPAFDVRIRDGRVEIRDTTKP